MRREIPAEPVEEADPTGCGDIWGAVACCRLLAGEDVAAAAATASRIAASAARGSGTADLSPRLGRAMGDRIEQTAAQDGGEGS